jgi:imidazolonepropionase-like amidohydrolase
MTAERIIENQAVVVRGGAIVALGRAGRVPIPPNARIINGGGAYLMPGLADMHVHTNDNWPRWPITPLDLYLANGVTTIRDFGPKGEDPRYVLRWREQIEQGKLTGPMIYAAGPIVYGFEPNVADAVRSQQAMGFDFLKLYSFLSEEQFKEAMSTARELDVYVAGHIPFSVGLEGVLAGEMNEVAHIEELTIELVSFDKKKRLPPRQLYAYIAGQAYQQYRGHFGATTERLDEQLRETLSQTARKLAVAGTPVCTTLVVDQVIVRKLFSMEEFASNPQLRYLPQAYRDGFRRGEEKHLQQFKGIEDFASFKFRVDQLLLRTLKREGVRVLLGTDSGGGGMGIVPGFSVHDELLILTQNGFTPYQSLATATVEASKTMAEIIGQDDFGTIEVGKRADLLLVDGNALEDAAHVKKLRGVMAAGRWYDKETLQDLIALE